MPDNELTEPFSQEELVAYLDGELEDSAARRIEELIQADDSVREEIHRLERAWDALGTLSRSEVDEKLTKTTVEMAAAEAQAQLTQVVNVQTKRRFVWWGAAAGGLMAAGFLASLVTGWVWPNPNQGLLRDLPVIRNLDQYQQADNLKFLRKMREKKIFVEKNKQTDEKNEPQRPKTD